MHMLKINIFFNNSNKMKITKTHFPSNPLHIPEYAWLCCLASVQPSVAIQCARGHRDARVAGVASETRIAQSNSLHALHLFAPFEKETRKKKALKKKRTKETERERDRDRERERERKTERERERERRLTRHTHTTPTEEKVKKKS